jgi:hypothetical protein
MDGVDDLRAVNSLQIHRGDAEVGMSQLALDDDQRDLLVGQLDSVRMAQLMRRKSTPDARRGGSSSQLAARGRLLPRPAGIRTVNHAQQRADGQPDAQPLPGFELLPRPAVHPDLATPVAFAVADKHGAAAGVEVGLSERERLADPHPRPPQQHDQRAQPDTVGAGPGDGRLVIDVDSSVGEVCGRLKQGAAYGCTKVLGYHPILATRADTREVLHMRLRTGSANTQKGMLRFCDELIARMHRAGATGVKLLRADSGFWNVKVFDRLERAGWQYAIGVRMQTGVRAAVQAIAEDAWQTIDYPDAGEAQIAQTVYRGRRLIVRRTRLIGPKRGCGLTGGTLRFSPTASNRSPRWRLSIVNMPWLSR